MDSITSMRDLTSYQAASGSAASLRDSVNSVSSETSEEELLKVCKDFASYFVEEILKEVRENMTLADEEEDSSMKTLTDFHMDNTIEVLADSIVDEVGESFTQQLFEQMKRNYNLD